jgi:Transcriptional regulators
MERTAQPDTALRLLAAIQLFHRIDPSIHLETIVVFLSASSHEGLSIKDLVFVCGLSQSMVSRAVESLTLPQHGALLDITSHPSDGRRRLVFLSKSGRELLAELRTAMTGETA